MIDNFRYQISVLVLTYNHAAFVLETLNSIEIQDFESIQVVIGDDCSSDNTRELIDLFSSSSRYDFVKIYQDTNKGITSNFNECLNACSGKYIFLLGGDDVFLSGKILTQYHFMETNPDVFISFHDAFLFHTSDADHFGTYSSVYTARKPDIYNLIKYGTFFTGCSVAVRNFDSMPKCNEKIRFSSDWLWYIELLINSGGRLASIEGVYSKYRRHATNITSFNNYHTGLDETILTLEHIEREYPRYSKLCSIVMGERYFAYSLKAIMMKDFSWGFQNLKRSLELSWLSPVRFFQFRFRTIISRVFNAK